MLMQDYTKVSVLVVGAGPSGLAAAITAKRLQPQADVCVIDKAAGPGNHNLSGAVLEPEGITKLLDAALPDWRQSDDAKAVLGNTVSKDDVMFFLGRKHAFCMLPLLKLARAMKLGFGQMLHGGDYVCSISRLTTWLCRVAASTGVEVMHGFAAADILWDNSRRCATGVKLVDEGLNKEGHKERNYLEGETIQADAVILAEGCDGLLSEKFVEKAGLVRQSKPLYSLGVKELIKVSEAQYQKFTSQRVVHATGWPIWRPVIGPALFGGGIMYPMGDNHIAVGMIVGLDFKYCDFNPQDALTLFKEHSFVKQFIEGGVVTEAGAKMIPEGGLYAVPRCPETGAIGRGNVVLTGDAAGLVNMLKIKGLNNAILSGIAAGEAVGESLGNPSYLAPAYTRRLEENGVLKDLATAKSVRQTVAKLGPLIGMPLSVLGGLLPKFDIEPDYKHTTNARYPIKTSVSYDKATFTALAATKHREEEPCHLTIKDPTICVERCLPTLEAPCITFCPAGVYESVGGQPKAANPSNCLHCKTCQRKCPFDNIRWTVPEGSGGPRYKGM